MKISLVLATYNGEKYLEDQLDSFLRQTYPPDELIISDDNSSDSTLAILRNFQERAPFNVRIVANKYNEGFTRNFGRALALATGDLIFPSDQDDFWMEEKISRMVRLAEAHPEVGLFLHDAFLVDESLASFGMTRMEQNRRLGYNSDRIVLGACSVLRREFLNFCLPIPNGFEGHDNWLHDCGRLFGLRMVISEPLQYYRIHGKNASKDMLNSPAKLNRLSYFLKRFKGYGAIEVKLQASLERSKIMREWVEKKIDPIEVLGAHFQKRIVVKKLKTEIQALEYRITLLGCDSRLRRIISAVKMWHKGYYRFFNGLRSLVADICA